MKGEQLLRGALRCHYKERETGVPGLQEGHFLRICKTGVRVLPAHSDTCEALSSRGVQNASCSSLLGPVFISCLRPSTDTPSDSKSLVSGVGLPQASPAPPLPLGGPVE